MAKQSKPKPIHLTVQWGYRCSASCSYYNRVAPIEAIIIGDGINIKGYSRGTFNPKKVTCKRCLKHSDYKVALDKVNNPLFYWKDSV